MDKTDGTALPFLFLIPSPILIIYTRKKFFSLIHSTVAIGLQRIELYILGKFFQLEYFLGAPIPTFNHTIIIS